MRSKKPPRPHDQRTFEVFCWYPRRIDGVWYWWERITIEQFFWMYHGIWQWGRSTVVELPVPVPAVWPVSHSEAVARLDNKISHAPGLFPWSEADGYDRPAGYQ